MTVGIYTWPSSLWFKHNFPLSFNVYSLLHTKDERQMSLTSECCLIGLAALISYYALRTKVYIICTALRIQSTYSCHKNPSTMLNR